MTTATAHRKALKTLRDQRDAANRGAESYRRLLEQERESKQRDHAADRGFREGVELVVRAMIKELRRGPHGGGAS